MKPEPKTVKIVCTLCGLDWDKHGAKPTAEKCVELLKAELARRPYPQWAAASSGFSPMWAAYSGVPLRGNDIGKAQ